MGRKAGFRLISKFSTKKSINKKQVGTIPQKTKILINNKNINKPILGRTNLTKSH